MKLSKPFKEDEFREIFPEFPDLEDGQAYHWKECGTLVARLGKEYIVSEVDETPGVLAICPSTHNKDFYVRRTDHFLLYKESEMKNLSGKSIFLSSLFGSNPDGEKIYGVSKVSIDRERKRLFLCKP